MHKNGLGATVMHIILAAIIVLVSAKTEYSYEDDAEGLTVDSLRHDCPKYHNKKISIVPL